MRAVLQRVAGATFDRLDLPALVHDHVDLDAVVADVDIDAILARIDLLGLATYIIEVLETGGEVLVVSQFTLYGDCRRGRRPGYSAAAAPETAERLYGLYVERLRQRGVRVQHGVFRATMDVALVNRGPVTILLDSHKTF